MALIASYLADTSALARLKQPAVAARLGVMIEDARVAVCSVVALELLYSARSAADHAATHRRLDLGLELAPTTQVDFDRAIAVQAALADAGTHRAVAIPDLIVAAVAERHRLTLLHYDADYDRIAAITGQPTEWVTPRGTADAEPTT